MAHDNHDNHHHEKNHPYHIIELSPYPILTSFSLLVLAIGAVLTMHEIHHAQRLLGLGFAAVIACAFFWWRKVIREGAVEKEHTIEVQRGLRMGMALFICSEVMFFVAFFWSYFDSFFKAVWFQLQQFDFDNLAYFSDKTHVWPPEGIKTFDAWDLPFMNTLILLLSGTTVTWAHHALLHGDRRGLKQGLGLTVFLGVMFTICQAYEYSHAAFSFDQNNYSSNFYMATGFHGFHVIVGTIFLAICWIRSLKGQLTPENHLGFEFAAWYWHFVDVVWLFLFVAVYWFGE
ncbi:MAG TPA: cytochrome c oxidase subunit 3 [Alphaproteobacteria bacterium]|nr:cytochrome c oxidase subunit 3 [Alphaproteobacteria bacterium]